MCRYVDRMSPHIFGCDTWDRDETLPSPNPRHNCVIDTVEHPLAKASCGAARPKAITLQAQFLQEQACQAGGGTGPEFPQPIAPVQANDCGAVALGTVAAEDACDADLQLSNDAPASFGPGPTTVTWTATNDDGQSNTATQLVTVVDAAAVVQRPGRASSALFLRPRHAHGACRNRRLARHRDRHERRPLDVRPRYHARDLDGARRGRHSCDRGSRRHRHRHHGPYFSLVSADITTNNCTSPSLGTPTASDACGGPVAITNDAPAKLALGTTIVTWTAVTPAATGDRQPAGHRWFWATTPSLLPAGMNIIVGTRTTIRSTAPTAPIASWAAVAGHDQRQRWQRRDLRRRRRRQIDGGAGNDTDLRRHRAGHSSLAASATTPQRWRRQRHLSWRSRRDIIGGGQGQDTRQGEDNETPRR